MFESLKRLNSHIVLLCLSSSAAGLLFGYDTGVIAGVMSTRSFIEDFYTKKGGRVIDALPAVESLIVVGLPTLGMAVGALLSAPAGEKLGRKPSIMYGTLLFMVGALLQTVTSFSLSFFTFVRFVSGIGVGLLSGIVPLYQAECSPKWCRGAAVATYQLAITLGLTLATVASYATSGIRGVGSYRIALGLQLLFGAVLWGGMFFMPESPRYLFRIGEEAMGINSLLYINKQKSITPEIQAVISEIDQRNEDEKKHGEVSYRALFKGNAKKRTLAAMLSQIFQQLTGVNFIFYYGVTFFKSAGIATPYTSLLAINATNVLSTLLGIYLTQRMGRRQLLISGAVVMCASQLTFGLVGSMSNLSTDMGAKVTLVAASCVFIFGFAVSWGIGAWVVCAEIFSQAQRSKGDSISVASNWITNAAIILIAPLIQREDEGSLGLGPRIGFIWAAFIFISIFYVYFLVPEMRGLSLEEIDLIYDNNIPAKDTVSWGKKYRAGQQITNEGSVESGGNYEAQPAVAE